MFTRDELEDARRAVHSVFPGTPQYRWPLLAERTGAEVWVKHENHTPIGAFVESEEALINISREHITVDRMPKAPQGMIVERIDILMRVGCS